jgi:hypothetical protein
MTSSTPVTPTFQGEPLTLQRAQDLARRGFQPVEVDVWEPNEAHPGLQRLVRRRTPNELRDLIVAVLGGEDGTEGIDVAPWIRSDCANCERSSTGIKPCTRYNLTDRSHGHGPNGDGPCSYHNNCKGFQSRADAEMPTGRLVVSCMHGSSEGDYVYIDLVATHGWLVTTETFFIIKTFNGRDAAWDLARKVSDILGL